MSRALAIATAILKISHSYVSAQTPTCLPGYDWTFNSLGESPCNMTISLGEVCYSEGFELPQLPPGSDGYSGNSNDPCECSTVFFSLQSACTYCQNNTFSDWSGYSAICTAVYDQIFPLPIPSSIVVPHYAYLDVVTGNEFNVTAAMSAGGSESTPVPISTVAASTSGATSTSPTITTSIAFTSTTSPTSVTSTPTTSATSTPTSAAAVSTESNVGAIVGGVVAGLAIIVAGVVAVLFLRDRRRL